MATITLPKLLANFSTSLAATMSASATSLTLSTSTDDDGGTLSGLYELTIDEGTNSEEHMYVTMTGSAGSVSRRGLSRVDAWTEQTANKKIHNRGASVKITNLTDILVLRLLNGTDTFNSVNWTGVNSISGLATPTAGETTKAANVAYVNAVSIAGANDATTTVKGIVEIATDAELQAGTGTGSTGAKVVAAGDSFNQTATANKVPVANSSGKLAAGWGGSANTLATLNGSSKVVEDPANATATPTASKIPIANGSGKLDNGWLNAKFGGDGSDGVLNVTSGTTTIDLASSAYVVKNYTSINVSAGATLTFSNPNSTGSIIVLKSQGNVTIAGTVNASGMGAAGGAGGALRTSSANFGIQGTNGTSAGFVLDISADHHGVKGGTTDTNATGGSGGAILTLKPFYTKEAARISRKAIYIAPGSGGGGGQGGSVSDGDATAGGTGGNGGGALLIEVGGSLDFSGTINVNGQNGTSAANASFTGANGEVAGGGGGGGGGAGMAVVLYNSLTANTGTITSAGGTGGNGGNATSTQVANGACVSGAGGGGGGSYGGAGGTGGNGKTGTGGANGNNGNAGSTNGGGGGGGGALIENPNGGTTYTGGVGGAAGSSDGGVVAKNTEWF